MNKTSWAVINFLAFYILILLCAGVQTSLFHWMLGSRPTIQLALVVLVYVSLTRSPLEGMVFAILSCYSLGLASVMLTSLNVFSGLCIFFIIRAVRTRVYSPGHVYFTWTALASVFGFHFITWLTALFEGRTLVPRPLDWLLEVLLTSLFVRVVYVVCSWLDKKTKRLTLTELNS